MGCGWERREFLVELLRRERGLCHAAGRVRACVRYGLLGLANVACGVGVRLLRVRDRACCPRELLSRGHDLLGARDPCFDRCGGVFFLAGAVLGRVGDLLLGLGDVQLRLGDLLRVRALLKIGERLLGLHAVALRVPDRVFSIGYIERRLRSVSITRGRITVGLGEPFLRLREIQRRLRLPARRVSNSVLSVRHVGGVRSLQGLVERLLGVLEREDRVLLVEDRADQAGFHVLDSALGLHAGLRQRDGRGLLRRFGVTERPRRLRCAVLGLADAVLCLLDRACCCALLARAGDRHLGGLVLRV